MKKQLFFSTLMVIFFTAQAIYTDGDQPLYIIRLEQRDTQEASSQLTEINFGGNPRIWVKKKKDSEYATAYSNNSSTESLSKLLHKATDREDMLLAAIAIKLGADDSNAPIQLKELLAESA